MPALDIEIIFVIVLFGTAVLGLLRGFPVAFTLPGVALIIAFIGYLFGVGDFAGGLSILGSQYNRTFGIMDEVNEVLVAVPLFVFMGVMLERSKVACDLLEVMGRCFGKLPGGLGLSVAIVGMLLAASTGIVGATVVTMGLISLPTMMKHNYSKSLACGTIAASGTLGQIIPPSVVLIILGDQISNAYIDARRSIGDWSPEPVSVGDLFAGALFPGLMLVGIYIIYLIIKSIRDPKSCPPITNEPFPRAGEIAYVLVPPIFLIISVLGSILYGIATPTEAASVGAAGAIVLAAMRINRKVVWAAILSVLALVIIMANKIWLGFDTRMSLNPDIIPDECSQGIYLYPLSECLQIVPTGTSDIAFTFVLVGAALIILLSLFYSLIVIFNNKILHSVTMSTLKTTCMVFAILIGAQLFNVVFRALGGEDIVHHLFAQVPGGAFGAMIVVMLVMFVLGFFIDFIEIVFIIIPIVSPVLFSYDVYPISSPVWVAIMMALNLQTSFLTPPFGFALFYLRGVAPSGIKTSEIYRGVIPFIALQFLALVALWFWPELATWLPNYIYG